MSTDTLSSSIETLRTDPPDVAVVDPTSVSPPSPDPAETTESTPTPVERTPTEPTTPTEEATPGDTTTTTAAVTPAESEAGDGPDKDTKKEKEKEEKEQEKEQKGVGKKEEKDTNPTEPKQKTEPLPTPDPPPALTTPVAKKLYCSHRKEQEERERREKEKEKEKEEQQKKVKEKEIAERKQKEKEQKEKDERERELEKQELERQERERQGQNRDRKSKRSKRSKRRSLKYEPESSSSESCESESSSSSDGSSDEEDVALAVIKLLLSKKSSKAKKKRKAKRKARKAEIAAAQAAAETGSTETAETGEGDTEEKKDEEEVKPGAAEYKRCDEVYDKSAHDWVIKDSAPPKKDKYTNYAFRVRRSFDWKGQYLYTVVDIQSPLLKSILYRIMGHIKGVSLVEETPVLDPNMIFNFYDEIKAWHDSLTTCKKLRDPLTGLVLPDLTEEEKLLQLAHVKLLLGYIDEDYKTIRATLNPLLQNNMITYDLLWAVLKPGTVMYSKCAGSGEPRAFRLDYAQVNRSFTRGEFWTAEGRYLEFDGSTERKKRFGWGTMYIDIEHFKGSRKIESLACYPLSIRKDSEEMKEQLIERGKKFVSLKGQQFKAHSGTAFFQKRGQHIKLNVSGRIMVDAVTFKRINRNYVVSSVKSRNSNREDDGEDGYFDIDDDACEDCCCPDEKDGDQEERKKKQVRWVLDDKDEWILVSKSDEEKKDQQVLEIEEEGNATSEDQTFEDDEYMLASPVVLGWAFTEKMWLEFPVANVTDITWNDKAFDSLVLPEDQKSIVRALVESHTAAGGSGTIDDIITGKGKGLVSVLHGPPGVGKTLTAESIAELLRRPLYCVSSGELGTNPGQLESELQRVLDIAHTWGAVLLLDEADVFMEKRTHSDLHRNALVSIFLRLLEYFQGILFLTTNRVESFDDAFQSRIHVALRYGDLTYSAKSKIWKMFLTKVAKEENGEQVGDDDVEWLAKKGLNGRQIKNIVRTAQALSKTKQEKMGMKHLKIVMGVAESFENDLKGLGRLDNMRAYV